MYVILQLWEKKGNLNWNSNSEIHWIRHFNQTLPKALLQYEIKSLLLKHRSVNTQCFQNKIEAI